MSNNKFRNECDIELAGKKYTLRGTFSAIQNIEQRTELSVTELAQLVSVEKLSLNQIFVILDEGIRGAGDEVESDDLQDAIMNEGTRNTAFRTADFFAISLYGGSALEEENSKKN